MRRWMLLLLMLLSPWTAWAEDPSDYAWQPRPGAALPREAMVRDESGRPMRLADAFDGRAVVLALGYFHCTTLCGTVRADLLAALRESGLPGSVWRLVVVSIDPAETPAQAVAAHGADAAPGDALYATASAGTVAAVSDAVGFRSRYDAGLGQFLHPAGAVVLTPGGVVSDTLLGVGYSPVAMREALLRAGTGGIAAAPNPVLLLCFHFDAATGRYTLAIEKVLRIMAGLTVLTLAGLLWVLHRR